jgi:hypothetical protein
MHTGLRGRLAFEREGKTDCKGGWSSSRKRNSAPLWRAKAALPARWSGGPTLQMVRTTSGVSAMHAAWFLHTSPPPLSNLPKSTMVK